MTIQTLSTTMYAVRDRASGKFLAHRKENGTNWGWTDDPKWIHLFKSEQTAFNSANGNEVAEVSVTLMARVALNVELERRDKFDACIGRFTQLELMPKLSDCEDNEYRRLRKQMRKLDTPRFNELRGHLRKL